MSVKFKIDDEFWNNTHKLCSTLLIGEGIMPTKNVPRFGKVNEESGNGTITFVSFKEKVYGITCWHVVEELRRLNTEYKSEHAYMFYTMLPSPKFLFDLFERVHSDVDGPLDIGILEISQFRLDFMGKEALKLDYMKTPESLSFGVAVGFPEGLKYLIDDKDERTLNLPKNTQVLSLPHCNIIAEIDYIPDGKFNIQSNLEEPHPYETYSGMSGGPVLWSLGEDFGIIGISREVNTHDGFAERKAISVACELATPNEIIYWIGEYERTKKA